MARARLLKPGFFTNELLAELPFEGRLLFAGLWTLADREGRLEERPRRIKAAVFPFDEVDVMGLLAALESKGFVQRYESEGVILIQVVKFLEHQSPHMREAQSSFAAPIVEVVDERVIHTKGGVYCIRVGEMVKIGCSSTLRMRIASLLSTHPTATVLWSIDGMTADQAHAAEKYLHRVFAGQHVTGEWFRAIGDILEVPALVEHSASPSVLIAVSKTVSKTVDSAETLTRSTPAFLEFPIVGRGATSWQLSEAQVAEWATAYPNLDVSAEMRKALAWLIANSGRRKTGGGMAKFLVNWLNRATDQPRGVERRDIPRGSSDRRVGGWTFDCPHQPHCRTEGACVVLQRPVHA